MSAEQTAITILNHCGIVPDRSDEFERRWFDGTKRQIAAEIEREVREAVAERDALHVGSFEWACEQMRHGEVLAFASGDTWWRMSEEGVVEYRSDIDRRIWWSATISNCELTATDWRVVEQREGG